MSEFSLTTEADVTPTPTPEATPTPTPTPTPEAAPVDAMSWLKSLDPEIAGDKSLADIGDVNNLAKSYINAQKLLGKKSIPLPDEFATEADWKVVYNKLGLPETLDKYTPELPETEYFDAAFKQEFLKNAHSAGVLPKQAKQLFEFFNAQTDSAVKANMEAQQTAFETSVQSLKEEWGAGFNKELKTAQVALRQFADEGLISELKESGLDSNPTLIRLLNKVGKQLNEDTFNRQNIAHLGTSKEEAKSEYERIMGDTAHPYWNGEHPSHKSSVDRMLKLQEILHSSAAQA